MNSFVAFAALLVSCIALSECAPSYPPIYPCSGGIGGYPGGGQQFIPNGEPVRATISLGNCAGGPGYPGFPGGFPGGLPGGFPGGFPGVHPGGFPGGIGCGGIQLPFPLPCGC